MGKTELVRRPAGDLEFDFAELLAARLPLSIANEKFERLWDEVNSVAAGVVLQPEVNDYIALLKRMHSAYESRYRANVHVRGRYRANSRTMRR